MQGWPEGRHPCVLEDAPGSCRGSITFIGISIGTAVALTNFSYDL
jgi:hypothetical protein